MHQPVTLLWAIGRARRGSRRSLPWPDTAEALTALLARHVPPGSRPRPDYPVLALHRAGLWEFDDHTGDVPTAHGDSEIAAWFARHRPAGGLAAPFHDLLRRSGFARVTAVEAILLKYLGDGDGSALLEDTGLHDPAMAEDTDASIAAARAPADPAVTRAAQYERWCALLDDGAAGGGVPRRAVLRHAPLRSAAARRAVLARSGGRCENPACGGAPDDVTDRGAPLLEVDHVLDLARGGPDHPRAMVALCPNCHAVKTRGRTRESLRAVLLDVARSRHDAMGGG
ncbi:HNH endonuclease [Streptomyces genisteinicus]|uniref:HNH endonuclease n=2 Tax=Streptomyces genisteinicus TaxID=2768068 RepID=A0A7H0HRD9_9ACTN|nr:HNH endonuclease [Streptomyces genisteinicus]